ncbi:type IV pilus biogenesis protein PilM [Salisediminibacterium halotolerans]|uniref:Type IV pilus assembly protein PilM n=1 Tax=Salisediminibacterium halotolerans TaxID=517425 RepID=A0A1H9R3I9_9BACI|nr:pilus assembly protein PilM [Salisediminibacterium haloalkalitolerans]SER67268.1 type IV pilus assembly protein PilM [Salisediminibacterium haloalkalitolerans]
MHDHVIRFAVSRGGKADQLQTVYERYLPPDVIRNGNIIESETLLTILAECLHNWRIKRGKVFLILPDSLSIVRRHQLPREVKTDDITGELYQELGASIHLPIDDPVIDWHLIRQTDAQNDVLLFAMSEAALEEYLQIFRQLKLKPQAADLADLSLHRYLETTNTADLSGTYAMIRCYPHAVNVSIFQDDCPLVMRHLMTELPKTKWNRFADGGEEVMIRQGDTEELTAAWQENIKEIFRLFTYYRYNYQDGEEGVEKILLGGDHPDLALFESMLKEQSDLPFMTSETAAVEFNGQFIPLSHAEVIGLTMKKEV